MYYSEKELDLVQPWPAGVADHIEEWQLDAKAKARPAAANHIWIEGVQVHMLALGDGRVWDVVNGFRSTVQDWRKEWNFNASFDDIDPGSGTPNWRNCKMPAERNPLTPGKELEAALDPVWIDATKLAEEFLADPQPGDIVPVPDYNDRRLCPNCQAPQVWSVRQAWHCRACGWHS